MSTRSQDFKYVYANVFTMRIAESDAAIVFAIDEDPSKPNQSHREEVGVMMTIRSLKILSLALSKTLEGYEAANGPILLSDAKRMEIEKAIVEGTIRHGGPGE